MFSSSLSSAVLIPNDPDWYTTIKNSRPLILSSMETQSPLEFELGKEAATCHRQLIAMDEILLESTHSDSSFTKLFNLSGKFFGRILHTTPFITYNFDRNLNEPPWLMAPSFDLNMFQFRRQNSNGLPILNYGFVRSEVLTEDESKYYKYAPIVGIDSFIIEELRKCNDNDVNLLLASLSRIIKFGGHDYIHQAIYLVQDIFNPTSFCHPNAPVAKFPVEKAKLDAIFKIHLLVFDRNKLPIEEYSSCLNALAWDQVLSEDLDFYNRLKLDTSNFLQTLIKIKGNPEITGENSKYITKYLATVYFTFLDALCDASDPKFCDSVCPVHGETIRKIVNSLVDSESGLDEIVGVSRGIGINNYRQSDNRQRYIDACINFTTEFRDILLGHLQTLPGDLI